jgi:tripartite-type tricarboxylate transporter receptor subunit TctC
MTDFFETNSTETTMSTRRQILQASIGTALLGSLAMRANAQTVEQVKIYYGFPPGSAGDSVARRVGEKLAGSAYTRNAAVVENRPGAGGRIALDVLKSSPSDGSVLALTPFSCTSIYPHIYKKLSYDPVKDLAPVSIAAVMHHGLAVGPLVPASVKTVKDFLAWAKANPNDASYGSPAAGSTPHFIGALLGINNGVELKHVPYRGSIPGVTDVVGGQIASMITPSGDFIANHKAGKLRLIATSGKARSPFSPEVPTLAEQGFPELTTEEWFGFYAPAKTPASVIAAANASINAAIKDKSVIDSLAVVGLIAQGSIVEEMARSQSAELERWGPLVKKVGFTAES